ncbi:MAG: radical SAM protein [Thermoproteota archaeon]
MGIRLKLLESLFRQKLLNKGLEGKPLTPQIVSYAVTIACNLRCVHCHADAQETASNELKLEEARQAIDALEYLGTEALIFSGGEPLLKKDFILNLTEYCVDLGIIPAMLTNGLLLTYEVAWELKEAGLMAVGIPLDSAIPDKHDELRGIPGAFDKAVKAINNCLDLGLDVVVTTMALTNNFHEIPKIIDFLDALGVDQVVLYDLVPTGRGKDVNDMIMSRKQRMKLINYLHRVQEDKELVFLMSGGDPLFPEIVSEMHELNDTQPSDLLLRHFWIQSPVGCHAGIQYLSLRPNGDVYPCPFLPVKVGNIREQSLTNIWYESEVLKELRDRRNLKGECGSCEYRESCGGCRGRAYARNGDYLATDPVCLKELLLKTEILPSAVHCFGWCVG